MDLVAVERRLRRILDPYRDRLAVVADGPGGLSLHLPGLADQPYGYVAGIRPGKRYVSFYLMPVYAFPELKEAVSPELDRRMQGKSCFNFRTGDEGLLAELEWLTARGVDRYLAAVATAEGPFADDRRFGPARRATA